MGRPDSNIFIMTKSPLDKSNQLRRNAQRQSRCWVDSTRLILRAFWSPICFPDYQTALLFPQAFSIAIIYIAIMMFVIHWPAWKITSSDMIFIIVYLTSSIFCPGKFEMICIDVMWTVTQRQSHNIITMKRKAPEILIPVSFWKWCQR